MEPLSASPAHNAWLVEELQRLLQFGRAFPHPIGGAAWLLKNGTPDREAPAHTWITARMAHVYSLAELLGFPGAGTLADVALAGLTGVLHDRINGGWYAAVSPGGEASTGKTCYDHAFVVLAASSASLAGRPGARDLLSEALDTLFKRFWEHDQGMFIDQWDTEWRTPDSYRGMNANMHGVEALLAAYDATLERECLRRALTVTGRAVHLASEHGWRLPEHFDSAWNPLLDYNSEHPQDAFKPYGATVGHALEWSRLILHLEAALGAAAPRWMLGAATALFSRAVADGWAVDGAAGFIYTTDWDGKPVVRQRMHWVAAEAIGSAAALYARTGEQGYKDWYETWWDYVRRHHLDLQHGSWWHELDSNNQPTESTWSGKPDLYHAVQATLIPRAPIAPGLASACAAGAIV